MWPLADFLAIPGNRELFPGFEGVYDLWNEVRGTRMAPPWPELNLMMLPPETIPYCAVVDVIGDMPDFVYRFWGTRSVDAFGQEMTGKSVLDLKPKKVGQRAHGTYMTVLTEKKPAVFKGRISSVYRVSMVDFIFKLPLSTDGETVDKILTIFGAVRSTSRPPG